MNTTTPQETLATVKESLRRGRILGWAVLAVGILSVLLGLFMIVSGSLSLGSARTEGTVSKLEPQAEAIMVPDPSGSGYPPHSYPVVAYYPVVEYQVGGGKYTYRSQWDSQFRTVGQKVPVVYQVDRPGEARIDSFSDRWLAPLSRGGVVVVLGVFLAVVSALFKWMLGRAEAKVQEVGSRSVSN